MTVRKGVIKTDRNGFVRCRVCGCTETDACDPPCSWEDADLCSGCAKAVLALVAWADGARRVNMSALLREFDLSWDRFATLSRQARGVRGAR